MERERLVIRLAELARDAGAATRGREEIRAQTLAATFRLALLRETPGDLPQAQFLCILAAVLGRFAGEMSEGDPAPLVRTLSEMMHRHIVAHGA